MQTLVPVGSYESQARELLGEPGFEAMLAFLGRRPRAGAVIQGTGGLHKVRVLRPGRGNSGGARVICHFHAPDKPLLLLLVYAKADQGESDCLTAARKVKLKHLVKKIITEFH